MLLSIAQKLLIAFIAILFIVLGLSLFAHAFSLALTGFLILAGVFLATKLIPNRSN